VWFGVAVGASIAATESRRRHASRGRRHAAYGALPAHCEVVGAALPWTLEQGLGEAFTPDVRAARTAA
jgi:hypothetical protein